jgi:hypothetical protein
MDVPHTPANDMSRTTSCAIYDGMYTGQMCGFRIQVDHSEENGNGLISCSRRTGVQNEPGRSFLLQDSRCEHMALEV